jgi:hypothetical protein
MNSYHIIQYPSGRFGFVGRVPAALAYEGSAEDFETARGCGRNGTVSLNHGCPRATREENTASFRLLEF